MKENQPVFGWTTWASSAPKDYLTKYVTLGGPEQVVFIEDVLTQAIFNLNDSTQSRLTDLSRRFVSQIASAMDYSPNIITTTSEIDVKDYLSLGQITFNEIKQTLPEDKRRDFERQSLMEIMHAVAQIAAIEALKRKGVTRVLRNASQMGLVELTPTKTEVQFVPANVSTKEHMQKLLTRNQIDSVTNLVLLWSRAGLLRGLEFDQRVSQQLESMLDGSKQTLLPIIRSFNSRENTTVMLPFSASEDSANELLIISNELSVPSNLHIHNAPKEVQDTFRDGSTPVVVLNGKKDTHQVENSFIFINTELAETLFINQSPLSYWSNKERYVMDTSNSFRNRLGINILGSTFTTSNSEMIGIKLALIDQLKNLQGGDGRDVLEIMSSIDSSFLPTWDIRQEVMAVEKILNYGKENKPLIGAEPDSIVRAEERLQHI